MWDGKSEFKKEKQCIHAEEELLTRQSLVIYRGIINILRKYIKGHLVNILRTMEARFLIIKEWHYKTRKKEN